MPAVPVAVRSSATAEDLVGASFAGQQDTYLWIRGIDDVLHHMRRCISSLYTGRAIAYRARQGYSDDTLAISVGVQKMANCLHGRGDVHDPSGQRRSFGHRHRFQLRFWGIGGLWRGDPGPLRRQQGHAGHHRPHRLAQGALLHGRPEDAGLVCHRSAVRATGRAVADRRRDHRAGLDWQADRKALRPTDGHRVGRRQRPARRRKHLHPAGAPRDRLEPEAPDRAATSGGSRRWTTSCAECSPARRSADAKPHHTRIRQGEDMDTRTEVKPIDDLRSYIAALEAHGELHRITSRGRLEVRAVPHLQGERGTEGPGAAVRERQGLRHPGIHQRLHDARSGWPSRWSRIRRCR